MIVWLIGISSAGKTTIGAALCERLRRNGRGALLLDGDGLRDVWGDQLGHDITARRRNHQRISELCRLLDQDPKVDLVVPALSIFPDLRQWNRHNFKRYFEVFLDIPLDEAMRRDPKGIYRRAKAGEIKDVAGFDLPFPAPESPDMIVATPDILRGPDEIAGLILDRMMQFA